MPSVRKEDVIAILLADIHLSLNPPIWRSNEPNWLEAQKRVLDEIKTYDCPVFCAGDILNWWDSKPELINFALDNLPDHMYCIAGQHDLPRHRQEDIKKSAYWTLVKANKIINIRQEDITDGLFGRRKFYVNGFSYGLDIQRCTREDEFIRIALVHDYVWKKGFSYPNAPVEKQIENCLYPVPSKKMVDGKLYGYDVIVYGDNHKGFQTKVGKTTIFNCGTLMRRASDEENYKPQVGLLLKDGSVVPYYLDTSRDKHLTKAEEKTKMKELDIKAFFSELEKLGDSILDFKKAILRATNNKQVKEILIEAMEK